MHSSTTDYLPSPGASGHWPAAVATALSSRHAAARQPCIISSRHQIIIAGIEELIAARVFFEAIRDVFLTLQPYIIPSCARAFIGGTGLPMPTVIYGSRPIRSITVRLQCQRNRSYPLCAGAREKARPRGAAPRPLCAGTCAAAKCYTVKILG